MFSYKRINVIVGWAVFAIAAFTYLSTAEGSVSYWDTGEYILSADKLEVVHPPGDPTFILVGRLFSIFLSPSMETAVAINYLSGISSAFCVLFLFWIITFIGKKIVERNDGALTKENIALIIGSAAVGALAFCFSDSFWFSAVEGEVYALSMFFTGLMLWAAVRWYDDDSPIANRWLVLIALMMGLSIGVHFLSLLIMPSIGLIIGYKLYRKPKESKPMEWVKNNEKAFRVFAISTLGVIFAFTFLENSGSNIIGRFKGFLSYVAGIGAVLFVAFYAMKRLNRDRGAIVMGLLIGGGMVLFSFSGLTDKFIGATATLELMVSGMGLPIGVGIILAILISIGLLVYGLRYTAQHKLNILNMVFLAVTFSLIGLSTYTVTIIRADANPRINMNKPADIFTFHSYTTREQYGHRPLLYGPYYTAQPVASESEGNRYRLLDGEYVKTGERFSYRYKFTSEEMTRYGAQAVSIAEQNKMTIFPRMGHTEGKFKSAYEYWANIDRGAAPTFGDNIFYFMRYQMGEMFGRYLLWNFAGRADGMQSRYNNQDGHWSAGFASPSSKPISLRSMAYNRFFMIPFLLGLIGLFYLATEDRRWWGVIFVTFLFMGVMNLLNSNEPPFEPRERDYALVGAFMAFAAWISFGVMGIYKLLKQYAPGTVALAVSLLIGFSAPALMAKGGWDDHDRSDRTIAYASAVNYLESCKPNAILFCFGDNDTYPLWYAQEVMGFRQDVRIVNMALASADWYISSMRQSYENSPGIASIIPMNKLWGDQRPQVTVEPEGKFANRRLELRNLLELVAQDKYDAPTAAANFPTKLWKVTIDKEKMIANGIVPEKYRDQIVPFLQINLGENIKSYRKDDLLMWDIIAANINERPIHFGMGGAQRKGFDNYLFVNGMTQQLFPVTQNLELSGQFMLDENYELAVNTFQFGGLESEKQIYLNDVDMSHFAALRNYIYLQLSNKYVRLAAQDSGKQAEYYGKATEVMDRCLTMMPKHNVDYYDEVTIRLADNYKKIGDNERALSLADEVTDELLAVWNYFDSQGITDNLERQQLANHIGRAKNGLEASINFYQGMTDRTEKLAAITTALQNMKNGYPFLFQ